MKQREFFEKAGIGSAALVLIPVRSPAVKSQKGSDAREDSEHAHGGHDDMAGPLAGANVSFGQWSLDPDSPLDRFPKNSPRARNNHQLIPSVVEIKAGGSANFIISGFHHILVYDNGTKPADIYALSVIRTTVQPGPPPIDDPNNRIYRGLDPSVLPLLPGGAAPAQPLQDRVETVRFPNPGKFLVICGVQPHFVDLITGQFIMFGYVHVRP